MWNSHSVICSLETRVTTFSLRGKASAADDDTMVVPAPTSGTKSTYRKRGCPSQASPTAKKLFKEGDNDEDEVIVRYTPPSTIVFIGL
uniref:Uncharacterized protein n=1 Tax=Leersia perrieri TaxID=77586 RepID=A0A0D9WAB5_9ORYZ